MRIAISPCPNDTYTFAAWILEKIEAPCIQELQFLDIQSLNERALGKDMDIIKVSFPVLSELLDTYQLLPCGSAISTNCGPIIVATKDYKLEDIPQLTVALPGKMTTASTFFSLLAPKPKSFIHTVYNQIETMVLQGKVDAGVLIHENRFTYQHQGLKLIADLGEIWNSKYAQCVPLGGVLIKKSLAYQVKSTILHTLQNSMMYASNHLKELYPFIIKHAQEKSDKITKQHIDLYVNKETYALSHQGLQSVKSLLRALHPAKSLCEDMVFSL